jgi:membrane-bound lytic murein transglycosylase MltF
MPKFPPSSAGRRLVAGVSINDLPYVAYKDGDYAGFDIEMLRSFAQRKGYRLQIVTMEFSALITALAAGKVELISDGISISEERKSRSTSPIPTPISARLWWPRKRTSRSMRAPRPARRASPSLNGWLKASTATSSSKTAIA